MDQTHIFPTQNLVDRSMRRAIMKHDPGVIWFTGLSGSGKSTLANHLEYLLVKSYQAHTYLLDGDNIRSGLNAGLGFSEADRNENIRRIGHIAKLMFDAGLIVLTAFISPYRADRDKVRALLPNGAFFEIYVSCPIEVCQQRDPKGLYRLAESGAVTQFTGIHSPYEAPLKPEMVVESDSFTVEECVQKIETYLLEKNVIRKMDENG
jgi:adenylylsulfate kinase